MVSSWKNSRSMSTFACILCTYNYISHKNGRGVDVHYPPPPYTQYFYPLTAANISSNNNKKKNPRKIFNTTDYWMIVLRQISFAFVAEFLVEQFSFLKVLENSCDSSRLMSAFSAEAGRNKVTEGLGVVGGIVVNYRHPTTTSHIFLAHNDVTSPSTHVCITRCKMLAA